MSEVVTLEHEAPTGRRPSRLGRVVVAILCVLALSAGSGVLAWLLTYQPLTFGNSWSLPEAKSVETLGLGTEYQFLAAPAKTFDISVNIKNTGPRTVTLEDVVRDRHYYWRLQDVAVGTYGPEPNGNFGREYRPFTPQRLDPGDYLQLRLRYEFADCEMESGGSAFSSFHVRYSSALVKRVAEIHFPFSVGIKNIGGDCGNQAFLPL